MEKNTIWAIVLSSIVLIGFMVIQTRFYPNQTVNSETAIESQTDSSSVQSSDTLQNTNQSVMNTLPDDSETTVAEENFTIETNKIKVVFTNRGGDIISYELKDHYDTDIKRGVELSDNVSAVNRTCALSLGNAHGSIINDLFTAKKLDDTSIGFYKTYHLKNADGTDNSFTLIKQYSFKEDDYAFKLDIIIDGQNITSLNTNGTSYTLRTAPQIGPHFDRKVDRYENRQFVAFDGEKTRKNVLGDNQFKEYDKSSISWAGITGKYFMDAVIPVDGSIINKVWYSSNTEINNYANAQILVERKAITGKTQDTYYMYFGPRSEKELRAYNVADHNQWNLSGTKLTEALQTSGFLSWLENILKWMLETIYKFIPNWGVSIIIMTIILKMLMFPLTKKSALGTLKMQELQPKMQQIQSKYKDDPTRLQQESAKLYKEAGYNPVSGCLPMLFTFVVLFAMYNLFNNYFEFRGSSFIPGWIPDLSRGDSIYQFKFSLPFNIGNNLRILPIIYVISQLLFGKITNNGGTAAAGASANQMKMMMYGMPFIFFFLFYNAPAGLLLFWTVSNIIQMLQQIFINQIMAKKKESMQSNKNIKQFPSKSKKNK